MQGLVLLGLDSRVLELGLAAVRRNHPLVGLWSPVHNEALVASLHLGCCAFPEASQMLDRAERIIFSSWPSELVFSGPCLDVTGLSIEGKQIVGGLDEDWRNWLQSMGFDCHGLG